MTQRDKMNWIVFGIAGCLTVVFVIAGFLAESAYEWVRGPIEAELAVGQVEDDPEAYIATRVATSNLVTKVVWTVLFFAVVCVWIAAGVIWYFKIRIVDL